MYKTQIVEYLNMIKPDVIYHRNLSAFAGIAAKYCLRSGCKLIWHIASEPDVHPFHLNKARTVMFDYIDKKIAEHGINHADYVIGQAKYQEELLLKNYGRRCDLIVGNWHPEPKEKNNKNYPIKIVWIANIKPQKQPDIFVELAKRLRNIDNVEFIMIGRPSTGKYQQKLEAKIANMPNLKYLGELTNDEVNQILAESHISINTSIVEGFANTFIQSWMRRVPVVSLNSDPDGVLKREQIGFHSGNFEKLVEHTTRLIKNEELRNKMGEYAMQYALRHHSIKQNIPKLIELIEKI